MHFNGVKRRVLSQFEQGEEIAVFLRGRATPYNALKQRCRRDFYLVVILLLLYQAYKS